MRRTISPRLAIRIFSNMADSADHEQGAGRIRPGSPFSTRMALTTPLASTSIVHQLHRLDDARRRSPVAIFWPSSTSGRARGPGDEGPDGRLDHVAVGQLVLPVSARGGRRRRRPPVRLQAQGNLRVVGCRAALVCCDAVGFLAFRSLRLRMPDSWTRSMSFLLRRSMVFSGDRDRLGTRRSGMIPVFGFSARQAAAVGRRTGAISC